MIIGQTTGESVTEEEKKKDLSNDLKVIEEVLVTASRRVQALQDVPAAVSSVRPEDFVKTGLSSLSDVIAHTPGLYFNNGGAPGKGSITARGVGQQAFTPVVAVYVDNVPVSSNSPWGSSPGVSADNLLGDVERVELLKGPQGTLYGATSIGGAVKYITRKPSLSEFRGKASIDLSNTRHGGQNQIYSASLSAPVVEDRIGITLSGYTTDNAGFVDRINATSGDLVLENANAYDVTGLSADVLFNLSDDLEVRFNMIDMKSEYSGTSYVDLADDGMPLYGSFQTSQTNSPTSNRSNYYMGTVDYQFDWATLTVSSSYIEFSSELSLDFTAAFAAMIDDSEGNPPGTTTAVPFVGDSGEEKYTHEVRLVSEENGSYEWLVGVYYTDEQTFNNQVVWGVPTNFNLGILQFPSQFNELAVYGNYTYYLTNNFDLSVGLRLSDTKLGLQTISSGLLFGSENDPIETAKDSTSSYLVTARYRPSDNLSLYARIASGYRPASANLPLVDVVTGEQLSSTFIEADEVWSYEAGLKGKLFDGLAFYDLALWYIDWSDFQATLTINGASAAGNAKNGISGQGGEASITVNPLDGLSITSNIAYTNSVLNEDEPGLFGLKGQHIANTPSWTASARIRQDFTVSDGIEGYIGANVRYSGDRRSAFSNDTLAPVVNVPTDAYTLIGLNAGLTKGNVGINFYITNLLNKEAYSNAYGYRVGSVAIRNAAPVMPRTIGASISYEF